MENINIGGMKMKIKVMNEFKVTAIVENETVESVYKVTEMNKDEFEKYVNETLDGTFYAMRGYADRLEIEQTGENLICIEVIIHTPRDAADLQEFYDNTRNPKFVAEYGIYKTFDAIKKLHESNEHAIYVKGFGHLEKDNFDEFAKEYNRHIANF